MEFDEIMYKAIKEKLEKGIPLTPQEKEFYDSYKSKPEVDNENQEEVVKQK